ncbi:MAG TPA: RNA 2',3'-cyclic phosphodiesterase [Prolixibacteraceae bacterium]|nr:RNA 2',3'-cyclic phosphodiesterase [Prolixibacteraceae bacterium]
MKRLFIGVPIRSEKARQAATDWQAPGYSGLNQNRLGWTKASNWHITIVFLGACPEEAVDRLSFLIDKAFEHTSAYTSSLQGLGVFPEKRKPNVLWIGLEPIEPLLPAYHQLVDLLHKNDFAFDSKPLKPHLTIARVKHIAHRPSFDSLLDEYRDTHFDTVLIDRVTLFESVSTSQGVRYDPLYEKMLLPLK